MPNDRPMSTAERAAAALREQQRGERRRQFLIVGAVVAVLVLIGGLTWFAISRGDTTGEAVDQSGTPANTDGYAVVVGDADAPLTMKFYEDPQCPICQQFEADGRRRGRGRDRRRQGEGRVPRRVLPRPGVGQRVLLPGGQCPVRRGRHGGRGRLREVPRTALREPARRGHRRARRRPARRVGGRGRRRRGRRPPGDRGQGLRAVGHQRHRPDVAGRRQRHARASSSTTSCSPTPAPR